MNNCYTSCKSVSWDEYRNITLLKIGQRYKELLPFEYFLYEKMSAGICIMAQCYLNYIFLSDILIEVYISHIIVMIMKGVYKITISWKIGFVYQELFPFE